MISDVRKAAIVLSSLPRQEAAHLLGKLTPQQVEAVAAEIAKLDHVDHGLQQRVLLEFFQANGERARPSLPARPFGFLNRVEPRKLRAAIGGERPQTIALVLSHLPPAYSAEVLGGLPTDSQLAVMRRIARMGQTSAQVIQQVAEGLGRRLSRAGNLSSRRADGINSVAQILNVADPGLADTLLESLAQEDPVLVAEIRRLMFVFEDLARLSDRDVQVVLLNVDSSQWAVALQHTGDAVKQKIMANMTPRAGALLSKKMAHLGSIPRSAALAMQQQVADVARRLVRLGVITPHTGRVEAAFVA